MLVSLCTLSGSREAYAQIGIAHPTPRGLSSEYLVQMPSLPILPVDEVRSGFEDVKSTLDDQSPAKSLMQQLLRYVEKQWLGLTSPISVHRDFPHATIRPGVESFHAALRQRVKIMHPNLFAFLGHLQKATIDNQSFGLPYSNPAPAFSSPVIWSQLPALHFWPYRISHSRIFSRPQLGTVEKSRQKTLKNTAHFCENRKNHGKITAVYIAANLHSFQLQKNIFLGKMHTTMTSRSHIPPVSNKAHGLW